MYIVSTQRKIITLLFIAPSLHEAPRPLIIPTADDRLWSVLYWWQARVMQTEQEAVIISDCSAGNISFYPGAWSSQCLHLRIIPHLGPRHKHPSWSMMRRAATRSDTSAPHIQPGHHQVWPMMWGCLVIPSLCPCVTWPGADSWYQTLTSTTQPGLHLHRAPHTKSAQNIALQSPCIKLVDVWLFATHGARRRGYFVEEICTASNIGF